MSELPTIRNRYRVLSALGTGGGGSVFEVEDLASHGARSHRLALKALFVESAEDSVLIDLLRGEFRALASLHHPQVARVFDFGRLPLGCPLPGAGGRGGYFFTRELLPGQELFRACQGATPAAICQLLMLTAQALDVLHEAGLVHRDFKPANVIVDAEQQPHLIDFGLARSEGAVCQAGTAGYLAPEVIRGEQVDRRADLYAFGISIFQVLTGSLPAGVESVASAVHWHLHGAPLGLRQAAPEMPLALDRIVQRLTQRHREDRYPSAKETALALGRVLDELTGEHVAAPLLKGRLVYVPPPPGRALARPLALLEGIAAEALGVSKEGAGGPVHGVEGPLQGRKLIFVVGDPGSGKSTLLSELSWRFQLAGVEVMRALCVPNDPRPLGPLVDIMRQLGALCEPGESWNGVEGEVDADRFASINRMARSLDRVARDVPLLLVIDGVEAGDDETLAALRFLSHATAPNTPLLWVVAGQADARIEISLGAPPKVVLKPLSLDEVLRVVAHGSGRTDRALAEAIYARTGGNPHYVLELARRLTEAGWPPQPALASLSPPGSLEAAYAGMWAGLDPGARRLLGLLAVLGRSAKGEELAGMLDGGEGEAAVAERGSTDLALLRKMRWVQLTGDGRWSFRRGATASVVYQLLSSDERRRLHGEAFKRYLAEGASGVVEQLRHALAAGMFAEVWPRLPAVLDRLARLGSYRAGINILEQVLAGPGERASAAESVPCPGEHQLRLYLARFARMAGDHALALRTLKQMTQDHSLRVDVVLEQCQVLRLAGRSREALGLVGLALENEATDPDVRLRLLACRAAALAVCDEHAAVIETVERALALDGAPNDTVTRAELLGRRAWSLGHLQHFEQASAAFEQALAAARAAGARRVEADVLNSWAVVSWRQGHYSAVEQRYQAALATMAEVGDIERGAVVRFNLGSFQLQRGLYGPALEHIEGSMRLFEGMGAAQNAAGARCNLGQLQLELGLYEQARQNLERVLSEMRAAGRRSGEALAGLLLGLVAARTGALDEARLGIGQAREIFAAIGQSRDAADAALDLAEVELEAGVPEVAARALADAGADLNLEQVADLALRAATLGAELAAQEEQPAEAMRQLGVAFDAAQRLDAPLALWRCHAAAVEVMRALGRVEQQREHAIEALRYCELMVAGLPETVRLSFWAVRRQRQLREAALAPPQAPSLSPGRRDVFPARGASMSQSAQEIWSAATLAPPQQQTPERFYRLLEIYRRMNSELDPERLLGVVMDTAVELTGAERGFLLLGSAPEALQVEVTRHMDPSAEPGAYSRSIAEKVFCSGRPLITVSAHNDPRFADFASVHQLQLESVLCIPIHTRGSTVGVLYLESRFQSGRFGADDQRLLSAFGDQVAIALTNARLHAENAQKTQQLQRAKKEIEALAEERGRLLSERTAQLREAEGQLAETQRRLLSETGRFGIIGASRPMVRVFELIGRVAATGVPVLIEGESGTGKEMVARALHNQSERSKRRLVSVNCAAIPEGLLESELFGHVRGAFTGADRERKGLFAQADGGTLFLDEIGDMPPRMQVDLLRALQEKVIRPVGAQADLRVDVRVLAASNRSLAALVRQGRFREDLFYRLHVVRVALPPLRDRLDDIPLLADFFLKRIAEQMGGEPRRISRAGLRGLMAYHWPGNVRQLEHALLNAAVLAAGTVLDVEDFNLAAPEDLAPELAPQGPVRANLAPEGTATSREQHHAQEQERILAALEQCGWNKSRAAELLSIPRRTFYRRLKAYGID